MPKTIDVRPPGVKLIVCERCHKIGHAAPRGEKDFWPMCVACAARENATAKRPKRQANS